MAGAALQVLPLAPDWSQPVVETLAWLSDAMQAATGAQQVRQLLTAPRRGFSYQAVLGGDDRRVADVWRRTVGVAPFWLPIWPDGQVLGFTLGAGSLSIPCAIAGYDFVAGGSAWLVSASGTQEVVAVSAVASGALTLSAPTVNAYSIGDRLYPLRRARLAQPVQETQANADVATLQIQCAVDEPCDWAPAWPSATVYRTLPVLDWRGDESGDPQEQYNRLSGTVDAATGPIYYYDLPGVPFRAQPVAFNLFSRADAATFRALAYQLAGQVGTCWLPDWQASFRLAQSAAASATAITVGWQGYTQAGGPLPQQRDVRIELLNGTALYRRITTAAEQPNAGTETLTLDSALGVALAPAQVRQINLMSVSAQSADTVQISHETDADGVGAATLTFQALSNDV